MTNIQSNKFNMYNTVKNYLRSKQVILDTIPAFETQVTAFESKLTEIQDIEAGREAIKAGKTQDKLREERELREAVFKVMSALNVFAAVSGNNELIAETDFTEYDLTVLRDNDFLERAYAVYNAGTAYKTELADYGITEDDIEAVLTNADEFTEAMGIAGSASAESKAATQNFKLLFEECDDILNKKIDKLVDVIKTSQPQFYEEYQNARNIIDR